MGGSLYVASFAIGTTLLLGLVGGWAHRRAFASDVWAGNDAERLEAAGALAGILLVGGAIARETVQGQSIARDASACAFFGLAALGAGIFGGWAGTRLLLGSMRAELARGNKAAGLAAAAQTIASALIASRAFAGSDWRGFGLSVAFFAIALVTLLGFVSLFRALTVYDDAEQIRGENLAAAISYAGATIAVAVVVASAAEGDFEGWSASLRKYAVVLLGLVALWPIRQLLVQTLLLHAPLRWRGGALDTAIVERRSVGTATLEAAAYLATAFAVLRLS